MKIFVSFNNFGLFLLLSITGKVFSGTPSTSVLTAQMRMGFIENKGQIYDQNREANNEVKYLYCSPGFNLQLRTHGFSYDTYRDSADLPEDAQALKAKSPAGSRKNVNPFTRYYHRVEIELTGSNLHPQIITSGKSETMLSYVEAGNRKGISDVHFYQTVTYKNIYPGIDLEFYIKPGKGNGAKAEYNFIVHPGADAALIKLNYKGANNIGIEETHLKIEVAGGIFNETIPRSYLKNSNEEINVKYIKTGANTFSFAVPQKKFSSDLIIDPAPTPTLQWCSYYGGNGQDGTGNYWNMYLNGGIALDRDDNIFITGYTQSASNIATAGAYQSSLTNTQEAFVAKFNPSGSSLLWGTYIAGGACFGAGGTSIACDTAGNVYADGFTDAFSSVFVIKFSGAGAYAWSAITGGPHASFIYGGPGIAVDISGNVFVTGTNGNSSGSCENVPNSGQGFVAKYNTSGSQQWSTNIGPMQYNSTDGNAVALDAAGNVYVTGTTFSSSGIATAGTYQPSYGGGGVDNGGAVFLAKFNSSGNQVWGTYYGSITSCCFGGNNEGAAIAIDNSGIYLTGETLNSSGITTAGAYQTAFSGAAGNNPNIFVAKFNFSGGLEWGTYYGGAGGIYNDCGMGIATDGKGNVFVTGVTSSATAIATANTFQNSINGSLNAFVACFDSSGDNLKWGSYFHGADTTISLGCGIAQDGNGGVYIVGQTSFTRGFSTGGAWQTNMGGVSDAFIAKFGSGSVPLSATVQIIQPVCYGTNNDTATVSATGGTPPYTYLWSAGGQTTATVSGLSPGMYTVVVSDSSHARLTDTLNIIQPSQVMLTLSPNISICSGHSTVLTASATGGTPAYTYSWFPDTTLSSASDSTVIASPTATTAYSITVTDANSCQSTPQTVTVSVDSALLAGIISANPDTLCAGDSAQLTATGSTGRSQWQYSADGIYFNDLPGDSFSAFNTSCLFQTSYYRLRTTGGICGNDTSAVIKVVVNPLPVPVISAKDSVICSNDSALLSVAGVYPSYLWNNGDKRSFTYADSTGGYRVTVMDTNGCTGVSNEVNITVNPIPAVSITKEGDTLISSFASSYHWYLNDTLISDAVQQQLLITRNGTYQVAITDSEGCSNISAGLNISGLSIEEISADYNIELYPNPNSGQFILQFSDARPRVVSATDITGRPVVPAQKVTQRSDFDFGNVPCGVYLLQIKEHGSTKILKVVVTK